MEVFSGRTREALGKQEAQASVSATVSSFLKFSTVFQTRKERFLFLLQISPQKVFHRVMVNGFQPISVCVVLLILYIVLFVCLNTRWNAITEYFMKTS